MIRSLKQQGYLMIDHRASPGLPADLAAKLGLDPKYCGEGKLYEADTLTCAHCKTSQIKNTLRTRERASCRKCNNHYICDFCAAGMLRPDYSHIPYEKKVELVLSGFTTPDIHPQLILPPTIHRE